jgi:ATP-binding cassette subfamily B protein
MKKIIKYLKPFTFSIIIVIGLLYTQAMCELSLPDYMSDIINVGIQQGGIDNTAPDVIRKSEFEKITLFLNDKDKENVLSSYTLYKKGDKKHLNDYPILKDEDVYKLKDLNSEELSKLETIMSNSIVAVYGIENETFGSLESMGIPKNSDPFKIFSALPKEQLALITNKIDEKMKSIPDSMVDQASIAYIKSEYNVIGINTGDIQKNYIIIAGLKMVGLALLGMIISISVSFGVSRISTGFGRNLRKYLFSKIETFSNAEFEHFGASSLITRTTNDISQVQNMISMVLRIVFYAPILGIGGVFKVLATDTSMGWIVAVALAAIFVLLLFMFIIAVPKFKIVQKLIDKLNLVSRESLNGMLVIRAFNTEEYEEKKFDKANEDLTKVNLFINRVMSGMFPMLMLIMNIITILIVWVGSHQVDNGVIQVGDMMAFIQYTMQIIVAFLMIAISSIIIPRASVAAGRIGEVLEIKPVIIDPENPIKFSKKIKGNVNFNKVSFRYPGAEDYVLKNISFEAKGGETTAFIGSTGCGKSTVVNLIPRFYDVSEGAITIDGVDIRNVTQHDLRSKIGYVPQKGILFSGTIASNLKYGRKRANKNDLEAAARTSQAIDFIMAKPDNFDEEIAQGGTNVSGGQKQRLSIARALIKKPEIFIFDDTFSALDFKTDAALRKALKDETNDATVLIVAQRISTIMNADQIVVLENGEIVGIGTHKELMKKCKVYKEIALSQLSKEELQ